MFYERLVNKFCLTSIMIFFSRISIIKLRLSFINKTKTPIMHRGAHTITLFNSPPIAILSLICYQ